PSAAVGQCRPTGDSRFSTQYCGLAAMRGMQWAGDCWGDERPPPPAGASADLRLQPAYIYMLLALHGDGTSMESRWNQHGIKMEPEWNHMEPEWNHMEPGEWNQDQNESHSDQNATQNATNKLRFELVQDLAGTSRHLWWSSRRSRKKIFL
ncbi:hypothetical protein THAOC_30187, partial [Thalassiosira oceanica]